MDHIAEEGDAGRFHDGLVHKPVLVQEALKIPEAKAVERRDNVRKILAWDVEKVRAKPDVIRQAKKG